MWRLRSLVTLTLAGTALLTLRLPSQQARRNRSVEMAAIPQVQAPSSPLPQQVPPSTPPEEAPGLTVVLDPAHGGADFGARGPTGLAESDVVLDFARAARIALEAQRLRVLLTREGNQDPTFDNRSAMVNGLRNAVLISLHVSSSGPVGTARAYYYAFPATVQSTANSAANAATTAGQSSAPPTAASQLAVRSNLIERDHSQRSSVSVSRQPAAVA